jgi:glycosyltransferase involved in cell wall biosynthesis
MRPVVLVIYTDAAWHPTVRFTAQMLSERGISVDILYRKPPPNHTFTAGVDFGQNTRLHPVGHGHTGWCDRGTYLIFVLRACLLSMRLHPDCVIGYERLGFVAAALAARLNTKAVLLYHNFDLPPADRSSFLFRWFMRLEYRWMRRATAVIASSPGRAALLKQEAQMDRDPFVVKNCQRLDSPLLATGELTRILHRRGLRFERLVVRLGTMGPQHAIEATIRSIPGWGGNWGLVLAGAASGSYLTDLEALAESLGVKDRVVILPSVPQSLWSDCLYSAHLGIALYEPGNINHASMAGAGNKLNLYLKAGIPSVVSALPDFEAFARRYGACEVAVPGDPSSIAEAVNAIFSNDAGYQSYCREASHAFETEYHFETQFRPVLNTLMRHARAGRGDEAIHE